MSSNQTYNFAIDALDASCYAQMNGCQAAANAGGNQGNITVSACEGQVGTHCSRRRHVRVETDERDV
jgi:hypothetical protein